MLLNLGRDIEPKKMRDLLAARFDAHQGVEVCEEFRSCVPCVISVCKVDVL